MTSPRSLSKKKGALYSFWSSLKICAAPAALIAAIFVLLMGVYPYFVLTSGFDDRTSWEENVKNLRESYKFFVFANESVFVIMALVAVAAISVLMGILIFRFCADKKTVNVYYSLGIKRTTLFYSRFFAGQVCLSLAVIPGVIISYLMNVALLGGSWQLSLVLFYFYCGLTLFSLLCFSVTSAVFASVGTVYEGTLFSVGLIGAPMLFEYAASNILGFFLKHIGGYYTIRMFDGGYTSNNAFSYVTNLSAYNPVLFMYQPLLTYSMARFNPEKDIILNSDTPWSFPDVTKVFIWMLVCLAAALLGGLVFFKRRKAENCGFLNTNKPLANLVLFELLCFVGAGFFSSGGYDSEEFLSLMLIALVAAFAVYIVYEILLKRNFNAIVKTLYKFVAHVAVFALICTVFAFDLTGTDSYVPKSNAVEKVAISSVADISWIKGKLCDRGGYYDWFVTPAYYSYQTYELPEFTEKTDIERITSLHTKALQKEDEPADMPETRFTVRYTLKDGREVLRRLTVSDKELCNELLGVFDTDAVKTARTNIILSSLSDDATEMDVWNSNNLQFTYKHATVTAIAPSFTEGYLLNLTESEFNSLKKAVADDLNAMSVTDFINGTSQQLGIIRFTGNYDYSGFYPEEGVTMPVYPGYEPPDDENEEFFEGDEWAEEPEEEINKKMDKRNTLFSGYAQYDWSSYSGENSYDVIITPGMTNTLAFLKSIGCENCFEQTKTIKSISFKKFGVGEPAYFLSSDRIYEYFGESIDPSSFYNSSEAENLVNDFSENVITDAAKITELMGLMRIHAYTYNTGYGCLIAYEDGTYSTMYLSENNAPSYVSSYTYEGKTPFYY